MKYDMYNEVQEQPKSLAETLKEEKDHMVEIAQKLKDTDKIYLVGCGSSLSTCYSARDALGFLSDRTIEVHTGYEFVHHKNLQKTNSALITTSQSGETADTLAALRRAKDEGIYTISITNEPESSMMKEADDAVLTRCGRETAILGTKTYMTQLLCLYQILFSMDGSEESGKILEDLDKIPSIAQKLVETTEEPNRELAKQYMDDDIFYCMGSGPNFGLAYKIAMTMLMEGALKHACPLYSGEFRHGLIERAEKDVPIIFLDAGFPGDELTNKSIDFSNKIGAKTITFNMGDFSDIHPLLSPFILVIPVEWFIYYLSHYSGEDPGSTRHIGKVRYD
ncbi:Glutamine--fructose-6-phosphate transaminase (isomerizing) [Methanobacterium lacus]|uniref:Glutamine--fructose-6-phosphate transaminase (Isomerizing) n=1 Tax=Methanobacterium lacus (strain AL-21) TaxID=877455 RepID=F0TB34_METLA|nr:SIS domain-containing protein [Methanobacterium lacus]ADZ10180.1 Glutamine--fructose-6-phosphate transaminase (isomerizing) [Methanobacterium lacus]